MQIEETFSKENLIELYYKKLYKSKSKGIDKVNSIKYTEKLEEEIEVIKRKVINGTYRFSPYIEILKLKGRNKAPRIISIPTIRDRLVLLAIKENLHTIFDECVNRKLPNNYIKDIKNHIDNSSKNSSFVKLDIKQFYDNINRHILIGMLRKKRVNKTIINLIHLAINTPTVPQTTKKEKYISFLTEKGVPQGLSISNILAQIYLSNLDTILEKEKYFYRRYVDDIIIINYNKTSNFRFKDIKKELAKINLELNKNKTEQGNLSEGFTFLSYKISSNKISVADKNIETFIQRIAGKFTWFRNGIKDENKRPQWIKNNNRFKEVFIEELNEKITGIISSSNNYGWLFYFSEITDETLLFKLDKIIAKFFKPLDLFDNKAPKSLKKVSRAFKTIKYGNNKNYICSFDKYDTFLSKRNYLILRGKIDPTIEYTDSQILNLFEKFKLQQIQSVEECIGYNYF